MSNQPVSFDDFKVLACSKSEFYLKIKGTQLISNGKPILNKNEALNFSHTFSTLAVP